MALHTTQQLFRFSLISHSPETVRWPDGSREQMDEIVHLRTEWNGRTVEVAVGRVTDGRHAYDYIRQRIHVIVGGSVQAEFVEADDYAATGELIAVLKKPGGNAHAWSLTDVPAAYQENFHIERFSDLIRHKGAPGSLGVLAGDHDYETMAAYGLLRWRDRRANR